MKIGILSDTHNLLRPEVLEHLQGCDWILHGGDISSRKVLDQLEQIAPVKAVRGNSDEEWAEDLPSLLCFELGGLRFVMAHKKKDLPRELSAYDLAICGHSHQYTQTWLPSVGSHRILLINPGSCGPRRFYQPITMAMMEMDDADWQVKQIVIPHMPKESAPKLNSGDLHRQIETVVRETQKGHTIEAIAQKYHLDDGVVEQIVRLYVTHPGVTVEGIMTKMGL